MLYKSSNYNKYKEKSKKEKKKSQVVENQLYLAIGKTSHG